MAALGNTNITTTLVRNYLSEAVNTLSGLCTSNNIKKWSRYKPTRGVAGINTFWKGSDGNCGLILPQWQSNSGTAGVYSNGGIWSYQKPNSNYRIGDFRGYDSDTTLKPPIYSDPADNIVPANLYPVEQT